MLTAYSKLVDNLGQAVRTQLVDGLLADLLQDLRFLRVYESPFMKIAGVFFSFFQMAFMRVNVYSNISETN
jgi:hypothetical protein